MTPMTEVLSELGIPVAPPDHHHSTPRFLQCDCGFCSPGSKRFRMGVPKNGGKTACCYVCGNHWLPRALAEASGRDVGTVLTLLGGIPGWGRDRGPSAILAKKTPCLIPPGVGELLPAHRKYLKSRGLDPDYCAEVWGVKGIGNASRLSWRLWLPCFEGRELASWTTRTIGSTELRYVSARPDEERTPLKELLYGENLARHSILICEGPVDAITIGPGAVATCGLATTPAQARRMSAHPVRVVCYDSDQTAQRRARRLVQLLSVFPGTTRNVRLSGKDANSSPRKEVAELRRMVT